MIAHLAADGKVPVDKDEFIISLRTGSIHLIFSFSLRSHVGIGSNILDLFGDPLITFSTSSSVAGAKHDIGGKSIDVGSGNLLFE